MRCEENILKDQVIILKIIISNLEYAARKGIRQLYRMPFLAITTIKR